MSHFAATAQDSDDVFEGLCDGGGAGVESEEGGGGGGGGSCDNVSREETAEEWVRVWDGDDVIACCGGECWHRPDTTTLNPLPVRV